MLFRLVTALAVLAAFSGAAFADVITLKNGRIYEGKVIKEENGILRLRIRGGTVNIPVSQIESRKTSEFNLGISKYSVKYREIVLGNDKELAGKIAEKIAEGAVDFAEAARRYSKDQLLGKKGGDRGWLSYSDDPRSFNAELQEKLFALRVGEVSKPTRLFAGDDWHLFLVEKALYRDEETGRLLDADGNPAMPHFNAIIILKEFSALQAAKDENWGDRIVRELTKILDKRPGLTCFNASDTHVQAPPADYTFTGTIDKSRDLNVFQFTVEVFRGDHEGCGDEGHEHSEKAVYGARTELIIGTDMLRREVKRLANLAYSAVMRDAIECAEKEKAEKESEEAVPEHEDEHEAEQKK